MLGWLLLGFATLTALFFYFQSGRAIDIDAVGPIVGAVALVLAAGLIALKAKSPASGRSMIAMSALGVCLFAAAGLWLGQDRIASLIAGGHSRPGSDSAASTMPGQVSVLIRKSAEGKFATTGAINSIGATLIVDTGATAVMLKYSDAEAAGVDVAALTFTTPVQTANGTVYAAPVRIRSISVGLLKLQDVEALVAQAGSLNENLLGMSFLRRLTSYELNGDFLTLRE